MKLEKVGLLSLIILFILGNHNLSSQEQTVGLLLNGEESSVGYTLFTPMRSTTTYLIDNEGREVNSWDTQNDKTLGAYLTETGNLVVSETPIGNFTINGAQSTGLVEEYDWNGNLLWSFELNNSDSRLHHDFEVLPNGNVLLVSWESKEISEAITQGSNPNILSEDALLPDYVIEVEPEGNIVWEWHAWDHLIQDFDSTKANFGTISDHPELIDLNYTANTNQGLIVDWLHVNGIDYNKDLDQIILSAHNFCEVWIIDHSTTTAEAASHSGGNNGKGGDLLYRWGNPQAYDRGTIEDKKLFGQHDSQWIESEMPGEGNILVFNNYRRTPTGDYSTVDEFESPVDENGNYPTLLAGETYAPTELSWIYQAEEPTDFYSPRISGAQRLENGNTLICEGLSGKYFEVTEDSDIVWEYINPVTGNGPLYWNEEVPVGGLGQHNNTFKIHRYAPDFQGFAGVDLTPGDFIELYDDTETYSYDLVDTGQSLFYNNQTEITEPTESSSFYGQDAQYLGNQPNYTDNNDGTITDNVTGLMWTKTCDLNGDGVINYDDKLTYEEALTSASSVAVAGYTDWRLPSIKEQYSLILFSGIDCSSYLGNDPSGLTPFIDTDYFDFGYGDTSAGDRLIDAQMATTTLYVSTTMNGSETMFGVNFADGRIKGYPSAQLPNGNYKEYYVYYVRGNETYGVNDFTDNLDNTITDNATGLMWAQNDSQEGLNWEEALEWAQEQNSNNYLGYNDWRLPNAKELQSIVDYTRSPDTSNSAAINPLFNISSYTNENNVTEYPYFWSNTTHTNTNGATSAAYVSFGRALGWMEMPPSFEYTLLDVHGAGAQRSDPKSGDPDSYPYGFGPQGDVIGIYNYVRLVRDSEIVTGFNDEDINDNSVPGAIKFLGNYPNPFNPQTRISFAIEKHALVSLDIYNIKGQHVRTLLHDNLNSGNHSVVWNGENNIGKAVSSGIYFSKLQVNNDIKTRKMVLLK